MIDGLTIREYLNNDFDSVTILWRVAREKSLPDFQREKGHFFFEDRDYFQDRILKANKVWVAVTNDRIGDLNVGCDYTWLSRVLFFFFRCVNP